MSIVSVKEYDTYGNLITDIRLSSTLSEAEYDMSESYGGYDTPPRMSSAVKVVTTDGYYDIMRYDEHNNLTECRHVMYDRNNYFNITERIQYKYNADGTLVQKIMLTEESGIQDYLTILHAVYEHDENRNLIKERRFHYTLKSEEELYDDILESKVPKDVIHYLNFYDSQQQLTKVIRGDDEALIYEYRYREGLKSEKHVYDNKELSYIVRYRYEDERLAEKTYFSKTGIMLKMKQYYYINERIGMKLKSPADDGFRWYLLDFTGDEATLVVEEEVLTPELMESVFRYIIANRENDGYFYIFFYNPIHMDIGTFYEGNKQMMDRYRLYGIDFIYT